MSVDRRTFLKSIGLGAAVGGPFAGFTAQSAHAAPAFRDLTAVVDDRDGVVRLHLPSGFRYRSFHDTSVPVVLNDGTKLPGRHDGMGAFPGPQTRSILIRNHEVNGPGPAFSEAAPVYDPMARGGTTTIDVDGKGILADSWASLAGTQMNCSGGKMPWGSWVSCEETVNGPDVGPDFTGASNVALTKPHGFIFEVPTSGVANAEPITSAGRFAHESVAWDPVGKALYLTEDNFGFPSGFYRYVPPVEPAVAGNLENGGQLQMLKVVAQWQADLGRAQRLRAAYDVEWVDIDDPAPNFAYTPGVTAPTSNSTALTHVSSQGLAQGAARFSRLEGCAYDGGVVYFCSTQGGGLPEGGPNPSVNGWGTGSGQIWAYRIGSQRLQLLYQSPDRDSLDFPDNVTTSARGTLILCEDNSENNYIRGLTQGGELFDIALNRMPGRTNDEFAGSTFSADYRTLFVNIQAANGLTFAIWGPWTQLGI